MVVETDFEQDDNLIAAAQGIELAAESLADWVEPMILDPITVADDLNHLRSLISNRNLPEFVKRGLPRKPPLIVVRPTNATRVEVSIDAPTGANALRHWFPSQDIDGEVEEMVFDPAKVLRKPISGDAEVEVTTYEERDLVARRRLSIPLH